MTVLVTRPAPDNATTAAALRALGRDVLLAPALRAEPLPLPDLTDAAYGAVIATSANALRAAAPQLQARALLRLPLFAVGAHTADEARRAGFTDVVSADGDAGALRDLVTGKTGPAGGAPLLYLAAADVARDLAGELAARGLTVETVTTYRMMPVADLPSTVCDAFASTRVSAVLHYSARSARCFLDAARRGAIEVSALSVPQICISGNVATVLREAGAARVIVAEAPNEGAMFQALERAVPGPTIAR